MLLKIVRTIVKKSEPGAIVIGMQWNPIPIVNILITDAIIAYYATDTTQRLRPHYGKTPFVVFIVGQHTEL